MANKYTVVHKKSNVVSGGVPKLPSASTLQYGEIAINYGAGGETLSIRNSNDQIATFPSQGIVDNELSNYSTTGHTHDQYSTTAHTHTAAEVGAMATSERGNYLTTATTIPNVDSYFDDVEYDSGTKRINFKHGNTVKDYIDATDFIKDGMVDDVEISTPTGGTNSGVTCLVVTFNTDAGKEDIEIPLSQIFNPSNFYNKTEANEKFLTISSYTEDEEVIAAALNELDQRMENLMIPTAAYEIDAMDISERGNYLTTGSTLDDVADGTTRKLSNYSTTAHTHTAAEVGAMATSERDNYSTTGHTHSEYSTTAHTHTAAEVGAMATSERSNYLPTGTTLDNVADGATRKLSDYSTTGHSHTAAEVGAMATSERGNYLTTATTIPTEATISGSGFTKNGITGINVNGTAATVTNGVAEINVQGGGGSTLPSVTAADNGKVLMVVDGAWAVVMPTTVYTGTDTPLSSIGNDGDIYLQTS